MKTKLKSVSINDWLIDIEENGDDGTGHCDYAEIICDVCKAIEDED